MRIPYLDLRSQYESIRADVDSAISDVIANSSFVRGQWVTRFESEFGRIHRFQEFIGTGNGTDSLFIALKALGIGPGDEVITAANSWIASSECISLTGATPVFADIEPDTYTLDPEDVETRVTDRTRAIIPVHLFGHAADMTRLHDLASRHDLHIVEDCAQAHLAAIDGKLVGSWGAAATFSFYPSKNLGAFGDAGGIGTQSSPLGHHIRRFSNHGSEPGNKHRHMIEGMNSRLDGLQAAVLSVKLAHLEEWTRTRIDLASLYSELLADIDEIVTPLTRLRNRHVFHVYCIRSDRRDALVEHLAANGIETNIHYPIGLPFLEAYEHLGHTPADYPVTHRYQSQILSLPLYPEMPYGAVENVASVIKEFF